jgi:uncharacterized protein YuzE
MDVRATYGGDGDLSLIYVYVTPSDDWPPPVEVHTEFRAAQEIYIDRDDGGRVLGVELIFKTEESPRTPDVQ